MSSIFFQKTQKVRYRQRLSCGFLFFVSLISMPTQLRAQCSDYTIGGKVWYDANRNGLFDAGETPLDGVTISFHSETDGVVYYSPTTNNTGDYAQHSVYYNFRRYIISLRPPANPWDEGNVGFGDSGLSHNGIRYHATKSGQTGATASNTYMFGDYNAWRAPGAFVTLESNICTYTVNFGLTCAPDVNVYSTPPNCSSSSSGLVTLNTFALIDPNNSSTGDRYDLSTGATYTGSATNWGSAQTIPNGGNIITNATAGQTYTVRVFAHDGCSIDKTVTVPPAGACVSTAPTCTNAVGGQVYWDVNNNGMQDATETTGAKGVTVTAYDASNNAAGTATTDQSGNFTLGSLNTSGQNYRLEFSNLPNEVFAGPLGTASGSTVQFISTPKCDVKLGLGNPDLYAQTDPNLATSLYRNGQPSGSSSSELGIVKVPYAGGSATRMANIGDIGSVYGLAYQRDTHKLFTSAFLKRHVDYTSNGASAIFITNVNTNTTSLFVKGNDIGIPVPALSRTFEHPNQDNPNHDYEAFLQVGKYGYGDLDISTDQKYLWLVNLSDRKLYRIFINNPAEVPDAADVSSWSIPDGGCDSGDYRPFGLKYANGFVYVTVTCTAETSQLFEHLKGVVYEFDATGAGTFTEVLSFPLTYLKGFDVNGNGDKSRDRSPSNKWMPWDKNEWEPFRSPTPLLSDIEFDVEGHMLIGIMDRVGNQKGTYNYGPCATCNSPNEGYAVGGDLLKAGRCSTDRKWTLENNGRVCGATPTSGANNRQGPGNGEFFYMDNASNNSHEEITYGPLAYSAARNEVILTGMNANTNSVNSGGIRWLSNATGGYNQGYNLFGDSPNNPQTFGKAVGVGDIELLSDAAPLEIGNRVWLDTGSGVPSQNGNGQQDAGESGVANVTLTLTCGSQTATTTTDTNGVYKFRDGIGNISSWTNGIIPRSTNCTISLGQTVTVSGTTYNFIPNPGSVADHIDSDGAISGSDVSLAINTSYSGANNHTYDFGFGTMNTCAINSFTVTPACNNNGTPSNAADDYRTFSVTASGTGVGATYNASVNSGGTLTPTSGSYGSATNFRLQNGSAGNSTIYTLTLTDGTTSSCTQTATVSDPGACTVASCSLSVTASPTSCNSATNTYDVNGQFVFSNAPTSGTLSATIGSSSSTPITMTGTTTSPQSYTITGLTADGVSHTVTASFSAAATCTGTINYTAPNSCAITGQPDLKLLKTASSSSVNSGQTLTYTITLTNEGTASATGVVIRDVLPAAVTYVSSSASQGSYNNATGLWTVGTVAVGTPLTLTITVTVN